ncbi:hypothetical protein M3201_08775 [Paenibacillus motobuensis]|nr:hypothetical protein [Paenibacillus lutimineralis]MCM3646895.1 hypothetical protein [Paenibacillus motobuensis]
MIHISSDTYQQVNRQIRSFLLQIIGNPHMFRQFYAGIGAGAVTLLIL